MIKTKKKAIICDLDGTLADIDHRIHFVQEEKKDWRSFSKAQDKDLLHKWCSELIFAMKKQDYYIILLSGRGEKYRYLTEDWLKRHNIIYDQLFLRARKDYRNDDIIKKEIYENHIKEEYDILFVLDDRLAVVKMWREIGLICLQCDWGNF